MNHLHLDCHNGAAGDMLTGALLGLCPDMETGLKLLNSMGLQEYGVVFSAEYAESMSTAGLHLSVRIHGAEEDDHHHDHHSNLDSICYIFDHLTLSEQVKTQGKAIYQRIAEAEGKVHGETSEQVHFHEVGALDAVADVAGFCHLLEYLSVEKVTCSPIAVGSGTVRCAHGILPVPAPATAVLLAGIPTWPGVSTGELCTPTGAAILGYFVSNFEEIPCFSLEKTAYGFGKKRFPKAVNAVTAILGTATSQVVEISCNLDDMTGEHIGFATEKLMEEGALDVWTAPIYMKKGRPGTTLFCLSTVEHAQHLIQCFFRHTTTLGVRTQTYNRQTLPREIREIDGVPTKIATGFGVTKSKPEFEHLAAQAKATGGTL